MAAGRKPLRDAGRPGGPVEGDPLDERGYGTVFSALPLEKACGRVKQFYRDGPGGETNHNKA